MLKIIILLLILLIIVLIGTRVNNKEHFTLTYSGAEYDRACNEIINKRNLLYAYMNELQTNVRDLSSSLIATEGAKLENMGYQNIFKQKCLTDLSQPCKDLASVDKYSLKELPDVDIFFYNLLMKEPDLDDLLQKLNYYSDMLSCPNTNYYGRSLYNKITKDPNEKELQIGRDIDYIDTEILFLELQKLSPYYLSPEVIQYILRFLISKEKLEELNYTSTDFVKAQKPLMDRIKQYF